MFATQREAHAEWHLNAGVPMGTPGCPQDACHIDYEQCPFCDDEITYEGCTKAACNEAMDVYNREHARDLLSLAKAKPPEDWWPDVPF